MSIDSSTGPESAPDEQAEYLAEVIPFPVPYAVELPVVDEPVPLTRKQNIWRWSKKAAVGLGMTAVALTGAEVMLEYGPGTHISAAGFETNTHLRFGHNYSEVDFGSPGKAVGHPHMHFAGINFGLKVSTDGSNFDLGNSDTRAKVTQILSHPDPEIAKAIKQYEKSLPEHGAEGFAITLAAEMWAYRRWRSKRGHFKGADNLTEGQRDDYETGSRQAIGIAAVILTGCALYNIQTYALTQNPTIVGDPSLVGSAAQGWMLEGSTPELIQVFTGGESTEKFDELTESNLKTLLANRPDFMAKPGWTTIVRSDDFQDVVGMARQEGVITKTIGADAQVASDIADEKGNANLIFDTLRYESGYAPTIDVQGNHDGTQTEQNAKLSGVDIGSYAVRNINGIPMLFLPSIDVSVANSQAIGSVLRNPNLDAPAAIAKAVDLICQYHVQQVDLHDNNEGAQIGKAVQQQILKLQAEGKTTEAAGCESLRYIGDGRTFVPIGLRTISTNNLSYTIKENSLISSGGHRTTAIDSGPIGYDSPIEITRENNTTHEIQDVTIWFHPDGTVTAPLTMKTIVQPDEQYSASGQAKRRIVALDLNKNQVVIKK